jgi:serine/threonine protein phosphatase 1
MRAVLEMTYAISDIHGYYDKYTEMLKTINLGDGDSLYIIGDIIDYGDGGVKILQEIMKRENVVPIMGNHEYMILPAFNMLDWYENDPVEDERVIREHTHLSSAGDEATLREFCKLGKAERREISKFVGNFPLYKHITVNGQKYFLVHGGIIEYEPEETMKYIEPEYFLFGELDFSKKYFPDDTIIIAGHTPTFYFDMKCRGRIYRDHNINLDCGSGITGSIGCLCLDTGEEFYV